MFIIVENESVLLGPMNWRKEAFESCILDDCEIEVVLSKSNDERLPIIINENIKILPVTDIGVSNEYDPAIHWLNGPYYNFYENYAEVYYTAYDKPLDYYKAELKAEAAANRYKYEIMGIYVEIQNQNVLIYTNREDRNLYMQAYQIGSNNVNWKFDNIFLTLSNAELGSIVMAGAMHIQNVFDWEGNKAAEIDNCTTLLELKNVSTKSDNPVWEPVANNSLN